MRLAFDVEGRGPSPVALMFGTFESTVPLDVADELMGEWNERNERAAGEAFVAVHTHTSSRNGSARHVPLDGWPNSDVDRAA